MVTGPSTERDPRSFEAVVLSPYSRSQCLTVVLERFDLNAIWAIECPSFTNDTSSQRWRGPLGRCRSRLAADRPYFFNQ